MPATTMPSSSQGETGLRPWIANPTPIAMTAKAPAIRFSPTRAAVCSSSTKIAAMIRPAERCRIVVVASAEADGPLHAGQRAVVDGADRVVRVHRGAWPA